MTNNRGVQKYPIRNIWSKNPPIRSEISDILSDFKISDISNWVSGKNFGFSDRDFSKIWTDRSENPAIRSENPVIRSEKFEYPKISDRIRIAISRSDIRRWTPLTNKMGYLNFSHQMTLSLFITFGLSIPLTTFSIYF